MEIQIPNIEVSAPTELVLVGTLSLLDELKKSDGHIKLNFKGIDNFHPFLLTIISFYNKINQQRVEINNISKELKSYLDKIGFCSNMEFKNNFSSEEILRYFSNLDFLPICIFEKKYSLTDQLESILKRKLLHQLKGYYNLTNDFKIAIAYLISELIDNIKEHSKASHGLIYLDHSDKTNLWIVIADNGITILGSYLSQRNPDPRVLIGINNVQALEYSLKGVSTKNNRETHRGYGLSTNLDIVTNGLNGDFSIISGDSLFFKKRGEESLINLPMNSGWDGTLILIKIPLINHNDFKYLDYIE